MICRNCGLMPDEIDVANPEDYFTGTESEAWCATCVIYATNVARNSTEQPVIAGVLLAANRARRATLARLKLAEDCASLFRDHLAGCVPTQRETDALTEWEYAAGVKPVPDTADDYIRAEDMA